MNSRGETVNTMKALVLEKISEFSYKDIEKPVPGDRDVLIRVMASAICGSDVHGYDGKSGRRKPPLVIGHEAAGVVEAVGEKVSKYKIGDRVVFNSSLYCRDCHYCRRGNTNQCVEGKVFGVSCDTYHLEGAMCEYISVPEYIAYKIPDQIEFEQAALIEPLAIGLHAINKTTICINDLAVVYGAGTIGLMILKILKISNCGKVVMVDIDEAKLEIAKHMGADFCLKADQVDVVQEIFRLSEGKGADIAFEAVGINATFNNAITCLKKGGSVTLVGNISKELGFPLQSVVIKEIKIYGSYGCSTEYETAIDLLSDQKIDVSDFISVIAPLYEGQIWFDKLHSAEKGLLKIVLVP